MAIYRVKFDASGNNNGDSWQNAFTDLQQTIKDAQSGDQIWVAAGIYKPGDTREDSFELKDGVTIYGGFAGTEEDLSERSETDIKTNLTTLSGNIGTQDNKTDNSYTVVKFSNSNGTATLDGFTIEDGYSNKNAVADIDDNNKDDINNNGGGVHNQGNLTIRNSEVKDNQANADGGGILNDGNLTIENSEVIDNKTEDDGGGIRNNGTLTIINSTIAGNESLGTSQTSGGGGLINTGVSATIINSTFSGNTARNGGAIRNDTNLELINSTLSGNTAEFTGGGLANTIAPQILALPLLPGSSDEDLVGTAQATITNSTITANTANNESGSGIANFAVLNVSNSIIADNENNDDIEHNFSQFGKTVIGQNNSGGNNLIGNGEGINGFTNGTNGDQVGTKNIPIDAQLEALKDNGGATETHALKEGSPAINAGNNDKIADDTADLDQNPGTTKIPFEQRGEGFERVVGSAVDIGAVEFVAASNTGNTSNLIINEIDVDTPGVDEAEFIELYDGGVGNTSLDGHVVVLYNGSDNQSYGAYDLDGFSTNANGYFVLGNSGVNNVGLTFDNNSLQNGADAVALYQGNAADFPNDTAITTENLIDAVVYDTSDADDTELLTLLNSGQPQLDENGRGDKDNQSLQRISNGSGGARNTDTYQVAAPTPGAENIVGSDNSLPGGDDSLPGEDDSLPGGDNSLPGGNDTLTGGNETVTGESDTLTGESDTLTGGNDTVTGGSDTLTGGSDTVTGGNDTVTGGSDTLTGGNDTLTGGNDTVTGGSDTLTGGNDTVTGGSDTLSGGNDTLTGGSDTLTGGSDTLPETTPVEPSTDVNKLEIIGTNLQKSNNIEVIDLRNQTGTVKASVEVTRDADYDNLIGFYIVNDANGGIKVNDQIINPGDSRYKQASLENRITSLDLLQTDNQAQFNGTFESGSIFAPFIIIDGTFADALNNSAEVYFAYQGANTDNFDHIRLLDDNSFGFEDLPEGGDKDYNDLILKMDFTV